MQQDIIEKAEQWKKAAPEDAPEIQALIDSGNEKELFDRFYKDLSFGTGGLRGVIGAGTNRMNSSVVAMATQGFASYITAAFGNDSKKRGVVIACDSRRKSDEFALETALVFCGNAIKTYLFDSLRPTPELSFAVRHLDCCAGVVITASHNPPEYNGYKAYWEDGGQLVPPHDKGVIQEVRKISGMNDVKKISKAEAVSQGILKIISEEVDVPYYEAIQTLIVRPDLCRKWGGEIKIVYSPIHGTGNVPVRESLRRAGFTNVHIVEEQEKPDGEFPTVEYPNPEERDAMALSLKKGAEIDADIVFATDPDSDRMAIAAKDSSGEFRLYNGNQIGSMLAYYIFKSKKENGTLPDNGALIKTIVTTELQKEIAESFGVKSFDVLTGFKYIGEKILEFEKKRDSGEDSYEYLFGGEESFGYLAGTFVRDKDAVIACTLAAEVSAYAKEKGISVGEFLDEIYAEYGLYREDLEYIVYKGAEGSQKIKSLMEKLRKEVPSSIKGADLIEYRDYKTSRIYGPDGGEKGKIDLPVSDVLSFFFSDGTKITARPSGTEPKIKFYFSVKVDCGKEDIKDKKKESDAKLSSVVKEFLYMVKQGE